MFFVAWLNETLIALYTVHLFVYSFTYVIVPCFFMQIYFIFSSPEKEVLKVSCCDRPVCVVHRQQLT